MSHGAPHSERLTDEQIDHLRSLTFDEKWRGVAAINRRVRAEIENVVRSEVPYFTDDQVHDAVCAMLLTKAIPEGIDVRAIEREVISTASRQTARSHGRNRGSPNELRPGHPPIPDCTPNSTSDCSNGARMSHEPFREAAKELQTWIKQLKAETDLCISEILDAVEPPDEIADHATQTLASAGVDRISRRIIDVMSAYDSVLESLGGKKYFMDCIAKLSEE